jgi:hypothetical protein
MGMAQGKKTLKNFQFENFKGRETLADLGAGIIIFHRS